MRAFALIALAVSLVAVAAESFTAIRSVRPISGSELEDAVRLVTSVRKPGDTLVISPLFGGPELAKLAPLGGSAAAPSDAILSSRRVLVLDPSGWMSTPRQTATETHKIGESLVLRVFEPSETSNLTRFDLLADLDRAEMRVVREGKETLCNRPRAEGGRDCPGEPEWLYLARRELVIGGRSISCVWAHPTTNGTIRISLPVIESPPEGRRIELTLEAGLTDEAAATPDGAPLRVVVRQDSVSMGSLVVANIRGLQSAKYDLRSGIPTDLEVTTDRDGRRHLCINARITEISK